MEFTLPAEIQKWLSELIMLIILAIVRYFEKRKMKNKFEADIEAIRRMNGSYKG